ncbi:hypothetical protein [Sulfitobacter sp.]|uniref:hypothetical protein n=1 Tax=Sulfitobacter sp. TaxID=1903071 RepID=UPI00300129FE
MTIADPHNRRLGSVSIPCLARDLPAIKDVFTLWSDSRFFPLTSSDCPKPKLVIVYNKADSALIAQTHALYAEFADLHACFDGLEIFSADLEGDRDLYARYTEEAKGAFGNKAGPNFLFQETMHITSEFGLYTLQIELDCIPLTSNWVADVNNMLLSSEAWVIGAPYLGETPLDPSIQFHINGNALYRSGSREFLTFLDEVWIRNILMLSKVHPNLAYDCWWALQMARSDAGVENAAWHLWQEYCFFFQYSAFVVNLNVAAHQASQYTDVSENLARKGLRSLFFHGAIMPKIIALLSGDQTMTVHQALATLEEGSWKSRTDSPENASESYLFLADLLQKHHKVRSPRLLLGEGFNRLEGPSDIYFPTRYVWSNASRLQITLTDVREDLTLFFREGRGRDLRSIEDLEFTLNKQGREIPCDLEILENPSFGALRLRSKDIQTPGLLEINSSMDTFAEREGGRMLGLLFFEVGCRLGKNNNVIL